MLKKIITALLTALTVFSMGLLFAPQKAHANAIQFELLGKLGGEGNFLDKLSLGDPEFNVAGGLQLDALFRFDMGIGIGLNFNWNMTQQRLNLSKLTYAMQARDRWLTVQYPSIGLMLRYQVNPMLDLGAWFNYGFGSVDYDMDIENPVAAQAFGLNNAKLEYDLQTFEMGIMAAFTWQVPDIDLEIVIGGQLFADFSRMDADDRSLESARDIHGRRLDENNIYAIGFNVIFGARYDLYFDK